MPVPRPLSRESEDESLRDMTPPPVGLHASDSHLSGASVKKVHVFVAGGGKSERNAARGRSTATDLLREAPKGPGEFHRNANDFGRGSDHADRRRRPARDARPLRSTPSSVVSVPGPHGAG